MFFLLKVIVLERNFMGVRVVSCYYLLDMFFVFSLYLKVGERRFEIDGGNLGWKGV